MVVISKSKKHLEESQCSYFEHLKFAIYAGVAMIISGLASIIHAVVPAWFQGTAAFTVIDLYKKRLENHPNPMYKNRIEK